MKKHPQQFVNSSVCDVSFADNSREKEETLTEGEREGVCVCVSVKERKSFQFRKSFKSFSV